MQFRKIIIGALLLVGCLVGGRVEAQMPGAGDDHRVVLTWQIDPEVRAKIDNLALLVDQEILFTDIPNQGGNYADYALIIDDASHQYQLFFDRSFESGEHYWQVLGYNHERELLFETLPEQFTADQAGFNLDHNPFETLGRVTLDSLQLALTSILALGTVLFFFFFVLFFILDLILSKGTSLVVAKTKYGDKVNRVGLVYDVRTNSGIPFALITLTGANRVGEPIQKTSVSDVNGMYNSLIVPEGTYTVAASKQNYTFPTKKSRASIVSKDDFYKGENIAVADEQNVISPMIPLDPVVLSTSKGKQKYDWRNDFWQKWQAIKKSQPYFELILLILSLIGLFVSPNWFLVVVALFYGILVIKRLMQMLKQPSLTGLVIDENGLGIKNAIVELYTVEKENDFEAIELTNEAGQFALRLKPGTYQIGVKKSGYIGENQARTVNADQTVLISKKTQKIILKMVKTPELSEDFFFDQSN